VSVPRGGECHFRCCKCGKERWENIRPRTMWGWLRCECGSMHLEWLNYEAWRDSPRRSEKFREVYPLPRSKKWKSSDK
jgi:hypothetical protein